MLSYKIKRTLESFNPKLINEHNIIIAQDKSAIRGDVMIDDCIDNLCSFDGLPICYAQPWNKFWWGFRDDLWDSIDNFITQYIKSKK